jgi:hypothetical protein
MTNTEAIEREEKSIKINLELTWILELSVKKIKITVTPVTFMFK